MSGKTCKTVDTIWEVVSHYDVIQEEGSYTVNDSCSKGKTEIACKIEINNPGTPFEFKSASPSDSQIREVFGIKCSIETDGDDMVIYVNRSRDSYPIGELRCISHKSLSPIQPL